MEPTTQQPDSKRRLYDALTKQGLDLGSYDEYSVKMQDPDRAAKLYDSVTSKGYDLGSREQYMTKLYGPSFQSSLRPAEYPLTSGAAGGGSMPSATASAGSVATPAPSPEPQGPPSSPVFTPQALTQGLAKQVEETGFRPPMPEVQSPARFADISQQVDPLVTRSYRPQTLLTDEQRTQLLKERDDAERTAVTYGEESLFKPRRQVDQVKLNRVAEIDAILKGDEQADPIGSKRAKEMYLAIEGEKTRGRIAPLMFASPEGQQALKKISANAETSMASTFAGTQAEPEPNIFLRYQNVEFPRDPNPAIGQMPDPREAKILYDFETLAPKIGQRLTQFTEQERKERSEVNAWRPRDEFDYKAGAYEFQSRLLHGDLLRISDAIKEGADPSAYAEKLQDIQAGLNYIGQKYKELSVLDRPSFREKVLELEQQLSNANPDSGIRQGGRSFIYGGTKAMASTLAGAARLLDFGEGYTRADVISDWAADMAQVRDVQQSEEFKESAIGKVLDGAGAMAIYIMGAAPGGIAAEVGAAMNAPKLAAAAGTIGTASAAGTMYAAEYEGFVRQAMEQGAPKEVAESGANIYAPLATAIEFFNPQLYLAGRKAAMEPVKKQFMSLIKEGMAPRTAMKTAMELADAGTREAIEELGQTLTERGVNMASNAMAGTELNTDISSKEAAETALVSFILGGAASGVNLAATRKERQAQRTKANVEAMHWAMQNPNEAEELIAKVDISEEEKVKAIEKVQRMASIFKGNNLKEKDTEVATNIVEAVAEKKDIEQDIKENPVDPAIEAAVGDPRKREVAEITKEIMSLMEIPQDRARAALAGTGMERVEEKVVKQPDGSVVLESKEAPKTQPKDEVDAILDEEFAEEPEAAVPGGLPEVPTGDPEATTAIETPQGTGVEVEVGPTGAVTPEAASPFAAPSAPEIVTPEPVTPVAQRPKRGKKAATETAAPAPTAEPVTSITEVKKSKDGSQVEYKVPGWEDLRIVVQREKGGYAANIMVGDQALKIQPKGKEQGTAKLAILDAKERLDRAGREKVTALLQVAKPSEQRPANREEPQTPLGDTKTVMVDGKERTVFNSNGKPIHPTVEGVRNFWRWFVDSKAVDAEGRPMVVYHGTPKSFDAFDSDRSAEGLFYFTADPEVAASFAKVNSLGPPSIMPVYLSTQYGQRGSGYFVVGDPTQIKSATGNSGYFAAEDPNVVMQMGQGGIAVDSADRIENVVRALRSIVPDLAVIVHDTPEMFAAESRRAGGRGIASDAAFYDPKTNAIHLNRQMASDNTLFHEAAHPILLAVLQNNSELFLSLYKQLATDPAFAKYIEFGESYSDKDELTRAAESLAEFMADVAAGKVQFSKEPGSLWEKFVEWLQELMAKVGLDFRAIDLSNPQNVRDFAAKFARGVREGIELKGLAEVRRSDALPMLQEDAQAVVDGWYSRLDQAVAAKGSTMPGSQWGKWLEARAKEGALSLEEAKWTGLSDWLASKGNDKVTPQQVREFLKENRVRVEVVVKKKSERGGVGVYQQDGKWVASYSDGSKEFFDTLQEAQDAANAEYAKDDTKHSKYQLPGGPLSRDTEILTDGGWVRIDAVQIGQRVLTRKDENGELEWQPVLAKPSVFAEELYHFKNQSIDMMVTADHKMVVKRRRRSSGKILRMTAKELWASSEMLVPLTGTWTGGSSEKIFGLDAGDVAEFMGWYIAEGSYKHQNGHKHTLQIAQCDKANPEKCERLRLLMERLGLSFKYYKGAFGVHTRQMNAGLKDLCHQQPTSGGKYIPPMFFSCSKPVIDRLLEGLVLGDGTIRKPSRGRKAQTMYFTKSKRLAGDVQALAVLAGRRATVRQRPTGLYAVCIAHKEWCGVDDAKCAIVPYNDRAFCVTVENHAIYVRRNGIAAFTGNSNYREVLVTLPPKNVVTGEFEAAEIAKSEQRIRVINENKDHILSKYPVISERPADVQRELDQLRESEQLQIDKINALKRGRNPSNFRYTHFDEPNILVHLRLNDRTGPNGEKILFIEELQSDWGQEGKKKGFGPPPSDKETAAALMSGRALDRKTPPAPFVTSTDAWVELGLKQAIRMAAQGGYDKIAWSTGEQQFNRWGSQAFAWSKGKTGWRIIGKEQSGGEAFAGMEEALAKEAKESDTIITSKEELRDVVEGVMGRERSDYSTEKWKTHINKIVDGMWERMQNEDSGTTMPRREGMKGFYDKILPTVAKKVSKKLGGDGVAEDIGISTGINEMEVIDHFDDVSEDVLNKEREKARALDITQQQHISITPEMRQRVSMGVPLMQRPKAVPVEKWNAMVPTIREALKSGMKPKEVMSVLRERKLLKGVAGVQIAMLHVQIKSTYGKIAAIKSGRNRKNPNDPWRIRAEGINENVVIDKRISEDDSKKLAEAEKLRKSIKKGLKKSAQKRRDVYLNELAKDFTSLRIPKTALDDYISMATAIKDLIRGASVAVSEQSVDALRTDAGVTNEQIEQYIQQQQQAQQALDEQEMLEEFEQKRIEMGSEGASLTLDDIRSLMNSFAAEEQQQEALEAKMKAEQKLQMLRTMSRLKLEELSEHLKSQELDKDKKRVVANLKLIDIDRLSAKDAVFLIGMVNNIVKNDRWGGARTFSEEVGSSERAIALMQEFAAMRKKLPKPKAARNATEQVVMMMRRFFGEYSDKIAEASGMDGILNASAQANRMAEEIHKARDKYAKSVGYKDTELNRYRAQAYAYLQSVEGDTQEQQQASFEKLRNDLLESARMLMDPTRDTHRVKFPDLYIQAVAEVAEPARSLDEVKVAEPIRKMVEWEQQQHAKDYAMHAQAAEFDHNKRMGYVRAYTARKYFETDRFTETQQNRDPSVLERFFDGTTVKERLAGSKMDRVGRRPSQIVDLDFFSVQDSARRELYMDTFGARYIARMRGVLTDPRLFEGDNPVMTRATRDIMTQRVRSLIKADQVVADVFSDKWTKAYNKVSRRASAIALVGSGAFIKQLTPLVSTFFHVRPSELVQGMRDATQTHREGTWQNNIAKTQAIYERAQVMAGLERIGETVARKAVLRGDENRAMELSKLLYTEAGHLSNEYGRRTIAFGDAWAATATWWAFYRQYIRKAGLENTNWKAELNEQAAAYASDREQFMQGANIPEANAPMYRNVKLPMRVVLDIFFSFNSFNLNNLNRMSHDIKDIRFGSPEARKRGYIDLAARLFEMAAFRATADALRIYATLFLADLILEAIGDDPEDDRARRADADAKKYDYWVRLLADVGMDFVFTGVGDIPTNVVKDGFNTIVNLAERDTGPKKRNYDLYYVSDKDSYGVLGILYGQASNLFKAAEVMSMYKGVEGKEAKRMRDEAMILAALSVAHLAGYTDQTITRGLEREIVRRLPFQVMHKREERFGQVLGKALYDLIDQDEPYTPSDTYEDY